MSTLRNLAHFMEDNAAPQVLPMEISVRDTHINLKVRLQRGGVWDGFVEKRASNPPFTPCRCLEIGFLI